MESPLYDVLLASHVAVPWVLLARHIWMYLRVDSPPDPPPKAKKKSDRKPRTSAKATHETFRCTSCGAAAPLADEEQPCAHCGVAIVPPPEIAAAYRRLEWADRALVRAERAWARALFWTAPGWVVAFAVAYTAWSAALVYYLVSPPAPNDLDHFARLGTVVRYIAAFNCVGGTSVGALVYLMFRGSPRLFPTVTRRTIASLARATVPCSNCGAEVEFAERRLATHCRFCGSEEMRPSVAGAAAVEAKSVEHDALRSIVLAHSEIAGRREMLLVVFDVMVILEAFAMTWDLLHRIPYVGTLLDILGSIS